MIRAIGFSVLIFCFWYLSGSFYSVSFNIATWTKDTRFVVTMLSTMSILVSLFATIAYIEQNK